MPFEQTDSCRKGGDFRCSSGSCRACDIPQLDVFKALQAQTNRLLKALEITLPANARDGAGQDVLWVDGRIGPKTTTAVGLVALAAETKVAPIPEGLIDALHAAVKAPAEKASMSGVATIAPELVAYFKQAADKIQAGTPPAGIPTSEERSKKSEEDEIRERKEKESEKKSTWMWWAFGGVVLVGTAGYLGYRYWYKPRKMLGLKGDGDHDDSPPPLPGVRDY